MSLTLDSPALVSTAKRDLYVVTAVFTAQIIVSHLWMKFFAFGPAEWLWRTLTYEARPRFVRIAAQT